MAPPWSLHQPPHLTSSLLFFTHPPLHSFQFFLSLGLLCSCSFSTVLLSAAAVLNTNQSHQQNSGGCGSAHLFPILCNRSWLLPHSTACQIVASACQCWFMHITARNSPALPDLCSSVPGGWVPTWTLLDHHSLSLLLARSSGAPLDRWSPGACLPPAQPFSEFS